MCFLPNISHPGRGLSARYALLLALCAALILFPRLHASPLPLADFTREQWQTERGLPQNSVYALVQDRDGFIWIGTEDGLGKFDGVDFETFRDRGTNALPHNFVYRLLLARDGTIWGGTRGGGIFSYDGKHFRSIGLREGMRDDHVWSLAEGLDGSIWAGTRQGIVRWRDGQLTSYGLEDGLPGEHITALHCSADGTIWLGAANSRLASFRKEQFEVFNPPETRSEMPIQSIISYGDTLYVGYDGIGVFPFRNGQFGPPVPGAIGQLVQALALDPTGGLWIGTQDHGVIHCQGAGVSNFCTAEGLSHDHAASLLLDREGNVWIGTVSGGLNRIREPKVRTFSSRHGLSGEDVNCVTEDAAGVLWVGTHLKGLFRMVERDQFEPVPQVPPPTIVRALWTASDDSLWIGTARNGLLRLKDGHLTHPLPGEIVGDRITSIHEDGSGVFWIGSQDVGLVSWNPGTGYFQKHDLPPSAARYVRCFTPDPSGTLWVGTQEGLFQLSANGPVPVNIQGIHDLSVRDLHFDPDGTLWIATRDSGIVRHDDASTFLFDTSHGLPHNQVNRLLPSGTNFWFSGHRGIQRVSREDLALVASGQKARLTIERLNEKDGLLTSQANGGYSPSGTITHDGRLWFPTKRGLAMINPPRLDPNTNPPPVVIQSVGIDGAFHRPSEVMHIPAGTTRLEIKYTALSFRAPSKVQFRHRLAGVDKGWVDAGTRRDAAYYNLLPGTYNLRVIACNDEGVWNTEGAQLAFVVAPFFYQTWWFYFLAGTSVLSLAIGGYRWRVRAVSRKAAELERMVNARTAELARSHQELEAEIQERRRAEEALHRLPQKILQAQEGERRRVARELHDSVNQPIASIKFRVQTAEQQISRGDPRWLENCRKTKEMLDSVLNQVRRISHNLRPSELDDFGLVPAVEAACQEFQSRTGLQIDFVTPGLPQRLPAAVEITLYRILQEALTNIEKHSHATEVSIHLDVEEGFAVLEINDNGIGFLTSSEASPRPGLGLMHIRERAAFIGGVLDVQSQPGNGVKMTVRAPVSIQPVPLHV